MVLYDKSYAESKHPPASLSAHHAPIAAYQEAKRQLRGALNDAKKEERVQNFLVINSDTAGATEVGGVAIGNAEANDAPLKHWLATPLRVSAFHVKVE